MSAGLTLLEVQEQHGSSQDDKKKRKQRKGRSIKITNTHLTNIDLSVDYPMASKKK
jgi:hypothetical protein